MKALTGIRPSSPKYIFLVGVMVALFLWMPTIIQAQQYDEYHRLISAAETTYFIDENPDSALVLYRRCFESFDFVFARDAANALQIAYREERPLEYYLIKAIESGVRPSILSSIPALSGFVQDSLPNLGPMQDYALYRSRYLDRINVVLLNRLYRLGITEQLNKSSKNETGALFKMALKYGLPGERNCGVEELGVHIELGDGAEDFQYLRDSISKANGKKTIGHYSLNDNSLITHIPIVIMLHDYCTYKYYEESLRDAYLGGFIHPREVGCIYDNAFRSNGSECRVVPNVGIFGLNRFMKPPNLDTQKADLLREKWGICSIETDQKKIALERLGYKFIWDYW